VSDATSLPGLCCAILDGNVELARLALEEYDISSNSAMVDALWKITIPARLRARSFDSMELERSAGKFELESTMTPLMLAVKSGSLDMVKLVLKTWLFVLDKYYGSKPEAIDAVRAGVWSAVSLAAGLARLDIVRLLVGAGAKIYRPRNEIPDRAYRSSRGSVSGSDNAFPPVAPARRPRRWDDFGDEEDKSCVFAALCEGGASSGISHAQQQLDRMNVVCYFLDYGHPFDGRCCFGK
jgi:hypothetical protein